MLKIKDNVDLKELEKFGFKYTAFFNASFKKVYLDNENDDRCFYVIDGTTREIKLDRLDGQLDDTLYDLIKADLVEKVGIKEMSKADEMFEELGYEKLEETISRVEYIKKFDLNLKKPRHISFVFDKTICVCEENEKGLLVHRDYFTIQELQAINEKVKELGWYE